LKTVFLIGLVLSVHVTFAQTASEDITVAVASPIYQHASNNNALTVHNIRLTTGVRLQYVEQGDKNGIPVIFLHGITDSWRSFETTLPFLPKSLHCFAISQRGHGDSDRPTDGYSMKHFASDVAAFMKQKNLPKAVIVGHSMGGVVAQQFVINYPELALGLVVMASDPAPARNPGMPEFAQQVAQMEGRMDEQFMREFQMGSLAVPIDSSYFNTIVNESMKVPTPVFKAAFKGLVDVDLTEEVGTIRQPTLIVWGDKDAFFKADGQRLLATNIENHKTILYEGAGHAIHWEQPERFASDLTNFISTELNKGWIRGKM
jgi:non-heme chloroperoxidase